MLPCQDAPSVKVTYSARVIVPSPLIAVMSAISISSTTKESKTQFEFEQKVPISSYLFALAVGLLESQEIGPRTKVWTEKSQLEAAAFEFSETEKFMQVAEQLMGPYEWGRYDLLVLPPSFPYGGMENPCLSFLTPTLIAGDRSNADVVAHELSHSWTGNLVTNKTWEHFWLNEGFTVFAERKIYGKLHGEKERHFSAILGYNDLQNSIQQFGADHEFTKLVPNLNGMDPDDAFSSVPYEKGFNFLFYLETLVGFENFEKFLKDYIQQHKFKCLTSEDFKRYFLGYFSDKDVSQIDWEGWFREPGLPKIKNNFDQTLSLMSKELAQKWRDWKEGSEGFSKDDLKDWNASQIVCFLDNLIGIPKETVSKMESLYQLNASKNSEIRFRWYKIGISAEYQPILEHTVTFLKAQGRMKFVRPLYRALFNSQMGKELAIKTFKENEKSYHNIAAKMIAKDLHLE
eukprot:TRINITY_DN893_c0_g2_i1.p1 TRINITY_DN893_c0_g2~~TRINITY_DN893_c0_g2_i1.p1  ORF type:complete len:459 (-),score=99.12 TRINITY_DN893_c0_g2_i1:65-1441(-)